MFIGLKLSIAIFGSILCQNVATELQHDSNGDYLVDDMKMTYNQYWSTKRGSNQISNGGFLNSGIRGDTHRWKWGVVPYKFSSSMTPYEKRMIEEALDLMNSQLFGCIYIRPARTNEEDYVNIVRGDGCWSHVGRQGGVQELSIGHGCLYQRTIIHEFVHALGYFHEQSRPDRDQYVEVITANIDPDNAYNFNKHSDTDTYGVPYDGHSLMHYRYGSFSKNGEPTLISKMPEVPSSQLGQSTSLTNQDILKLKRMYRCDPEIYPDPICPSVGCPVEQLVAYEPAGETYQACVFRCDQVTEGKTARARDGSGFECFESDEKKRQYNWCCRSMSVPGGIQKCP